MARGLSFDVKVYKADAEKAVRRLEKKLERQGHLSVQETADLGKQYARKRAPFDSGATFRNIILPKSSGSEASVVAQNPTPNKEWDGESFNLVRWMHTSPNNSRIRSGDPEFMYSTYDYLREKFPDVIADGFNKIIAKGE